MPEFNGYTQSAFQFLESLQINNNREWFHENKEQYESLVREPTLDFITSMNEPLHNISPHFLAEPKKSGGSMMRPYRDTRFSKDKTPYKTNIGIQFRHRSGKDIHAPGYYVHIEANEAFIGIGLWKPDSDALQLIRQSISSEFNQWQEIVASLEERGFGFVGESLKRPPKHFEATDPAIEHLKRKSCMMIKPVEIEKAQNREFVAMVINEFDRSSAFMQFLCRALNISF